MGKDIKEILEGAYGGFSLDQLRAEQGRILSSPDLVNVVDGKMELGYDAQQRATLNYIQARIGEMKNGVGKGRVSTF